MEIEWNHTTSHQLAVKWHLFLCVRVSMNVEIVKLPIKIGRRYPYKSGISRVNLSLHRKLMVKCPKVACILFQNATWMCIKLGHKATFHPSSGLLRKPPEKMWPLLVRIQPQLLCIWYIWHAWAVVIWCWISRELGLRFISLGLHLYVSQLYLTYVMCGENWRAPRGMLCNVIFSHELVQSVRYWCENNFCLRVYATFAYKIWIFGV